jgi:cell division protein FtsZ
MKGNIQALTEILEGIKQHHLTTTKNTNVGNRADENVEVMEFDLPKDSSSIIKVIGIGGGGGNAVNHMYNLGIKGVDFVICNTDQQALDISPVPLKIQLGQSLTEGRGAGAIPEIGKNAAIENIDEIKEILGANTKMVFITAGMGGGTGTGAAPVIAKIAKEMDILTVGIVTVPFAFEGRKRKLQAEEGLEELRQSVDTLLIINNDRLREMFGNLTLGNAFSQADDVLATAAKGIAEVISVTGMINVDFNDVSTVMKDSGVAIMGSAEAVGENRAHEAVRNALSSPLLNDNDIKGAKYVLLNITYGNSEILMDEIGDITDYIQEEAGATADVIWGHGHDESLGDAICITLIATGFNSSPITGFEKAPEKKVVSLDDETVPTMISQPIESPTQVNKLETKVDEVKETVEEEPFLIVKEEVVAQTEINWSVDQTLFDR